MRAPFPWFGGKSRAASLIWSRLGSPASYTEPFAGSLAVLLARPGSDWGVETVNDADGLLVNFWRALQADPEAVARHADWPVSEVDLIARHLWLVEHRAAVVGAMEADPEYLDARLAGWWVWGICSWIGSGWCSGDGPWQRSDDGAAVVVGNAGRGVNRQLPHLGDAGRGVRDWMLDLAARLRRVRICCGDWQRVCTPSARGTRAGVAAYLLDPPYDDGFSPDGAYAGGGAAVWGDAARWAVEAATEADVRIALCGYAGAWEQAGLVEPSGWTVEAWTTAGGYGGGRGGDGEANARRERIWFSPGCLAPAQGRLFG